jgi:hypothetical protein
MEVRISEGIHAESNASQDLRDDPSHCRQWSHNRWISGMEGTIKLSQRMLAFRICQLPTAADR